MILAHLASYFDATWAYADAQAVTAEIAQVVPEYAGLTWEALGDEGVQWDAAQATYAFAYAPAEQPALPADGASSLALVTGTVLYDDGALFRLTPHLHNAAFGAHVALNPEDAERLGLAAGAAVTVSNNYGALQLAVKVDGSVKPGTAWIPESLQGQPVGALLNGSATAHVQVTA